MDLVPFSFSALKKKSLNFYDLVVLLSTVMSTHENMEGIVLDLQMGASFLVAFKSVIDLI